MYATADIARTHVHTYTQHDVVLNVTLWEYIMALIFAVSEAIKSISSYLWISEHHVYPALPDDRSGSSIHCQGGKILLVFLVI